MADSTQSLTPSELLGIIKQGLWELNSYINNTAYDPSFSPGLCISHMERLTMRMGQLEAVTPPPPANGKGAAVETRKN